MRFFHIIFNLITSITQIIISKKCLNHDGNSCYEKKCYRCNLTFDICRDLKKHNFLCHSWFGRQLPVEYKSVNILERSNFLTTFSINFEQHQDFYSFFNSEKLADDFLSVDELKYLLAENIEVQGTFSLRNYQPAESEYLVETINKRSWTIDVYDCMFFYNKYVKRGLKRDMLKRVIVNGLTGSGWRFKSFHHLAINVKNKKLTTVGI